ncbi:hypothetical protein NHQ30_000898 [Ciborinia camelliae]|nr:hypothetical protein NHQ30_000898 [Ciborinia camelliae]
MPIVERFKRGFNSTKARFGHRSEHVQEPSQPELDLDATNPVGLSIKNDDETAIQEDKEAAGKQAQIPAHDDSACSSKSSPTASKQWRFSSEDDLWSQASAKLKSDDPELYEEYSRIIQREGGKSIENKLDKTSKSFANAATLLEVCQNSLQTMKSSSGKADKILEKTVKIVGLAKDFVGAAVSAEPHAAVAWAGDEACRKGLEDIPFLIQKYSLVESICAIENPDPTVANAQHTLSVEIVELYTRILGFQAEVVCQLGRSKIKAYFRKAFKADDWEKMHHDVLRIETRCWGMAQAINSDRCSKLLEECSRKFAEMYTIGSEPLKVTKETYQAVINLGQESEQRERTKDEIECLQSFRWGNLYEEQKDRNPDRVEGTCNWLLESPTFRDWRNKKNPGLLWISADPGCGKSVLSKAFVDERLVALSPATIICYFFFKDISPDQRNVKRAVAALIHQIISLNRHLWKHAIDSWKRNGREICNLHDMMWDILEAMATDTAAGDIVCVIDALDECDTAHDVRKQFIWRMHKLVFGTQPCRMRFVVTSRPYAQIERIFTGLNLNFPVIRIAGEMESETISREINLVINHEVARLDLDDEDVKNHIGTRLKEMEHRTYLWLHLIMEVIRKRIESSGQPSNIDKSLQSLPETVEKLYEEILNKSAFREETEKLLHIIVGAERPLSTEEINVAMHIEMRYDGTQSFNDIRLENSQRYPGMLRNLCGLFIQFVDSKAYLIHQTAKEFLVATQSEPKIPGTWRHCLEPLETQQVLAQVCISYLYLSDIDTILGEVNCTGTRTDYEASEKIKASMAFTFIVYWARNWTVHYRRIPGLFNRDKIVELCSNSIRRTVWICTLNGRTFSRTFSRTKLPPFDLMELISDSTTALMITAYFNLYEAAEYITSASDFHKYDLELCSDNYTALALAVESQSFDMVELLVYKGADVNHITERGAPLSIAARRGDLPILKFLLENQAIDQRSPHMTALDIAINKSPNIVQTLLSSGKGPQFEGYLERALRFAVLKQSVELVELLLASGADPTYEISKEYGRSKTCLTAVFERYEPREGAVILRLLLSKAKPLSCEAVRDLLVWSAKSKFDEGDLVQLVLNHPRQSGFRLDVEESPLVTAALFGNYKVLEVLINVPHDINGCQASGWWSMHYSKDFIVWGWPRRLKELSNLPNLSIKDYFEELQPFQIPAPLFAGIVSRSGEIVQFLIDRGANVNMITPLGTPLFFAAGTGISFMVQLLIQNGANIIVYDSEGNEEPSPLVIATAQGAIDIVKILLKAGAKVDQGSASTHSIYAAKRSGMDVITSNKYYPSAIEAAEMEGHEEVARFLREYKAIEIFFDVDEDAQMPGKVEEVEEDCMG